VISESKLNQLINYGPVIAATTACEMAYSV